ncbi:MAG: hypothetical protein R3199_11065, partial [Gemmatimonadota bacterium]|nr:hypothetical protein [Gemmatimonadota bacterium]
MTGGDLLIVNLAQLVDPGSGSGGEPMETVEHAFLWIEGGRIAARGPMDEAPGEGDEAPPLRGRRSRRPHAGARVCEAEGEPGPGPDGRLGSAACGSPAVAAEQPSIRHERNRVLDV